MIMTDSIDLMNKNDIISQKGEIHVIDNFG